MFSHVRVVQSFTCVTIIFPTRNTCRLQTSVKETGPTKFLQYTHSAMVKVLLKNSGSELWSVLAPKLNCVWLLRHAPLQNFVMIHHQLLKLLAKFVKLPYPTVEKIHFKFCCKYSSEYMYVDNILSCSADRQTEKHKGKNIAFLVGITNLSFLSWLTNPGWYTNGWNTEHNMHCGTAGGSCKTNWRDKWC